MGLFESWQRKKRIQKAAEEMWYIVRSGVNFEVPLSFQKDDLFVEALVELQRRHPGVQMRLYQSRGLVVGNFDKRSGGGMNVAEDTFRQLLRSGHIRESEGRDLSVENFLLQHELFLRKQGLDPKEQEKEAQEARMKDEAISVTTKGTESAS